MRGVFELSRRLVFKRELRERLGVSYTTIWQWMRDGKFPRSRQVGNRVAWIDEDIEAWLDGLPPQRLKGDAP